jgi:ABC-2 type transport system ATP-binding protein
MNDPAYTASATSYGTIEELIRGAKGHSSHIECSTSLAGRALEAVPDTYHGCRCAFFLPTDNGFERETVLSYLQFFTRIAGCSKNPHVAMAQFGLEKRSKTPVRKLTKEEWALLNFSRMSLFEPDVCFCEQPLLDLKAPSRELVLSWMASQIDRGTVFITVGQSKRDALLMPGNAWEEADGRLVSLDEDAHEAHFHAFDEPFAFKVVAKLGTATVLIEPQDIDFAESQGRVTYAYAHGELYPTAMTMDELEQNLGKFGFFRSHRSYLVNTQRIARIERYTRSSFNLTLSNAESTTVPLAKGRAAKLRGLFGPH